MEWERIIPLIGPATAAIAHYDGVLAALHNTDVLLSPLTTQKAVLFSRIEGTQTTMAEVLEYEATGENRQYDPNRKADIHEVLNYRKAMHEAERLLENLPLSQRLFKELHRVLLDGVRRHGKSPGEYRKIPNWLGPHGCTIEEAYFVPISVDKLDKGMNKWERFIHEEFPDVLVQLAILYVEFEALHPFLDGNGRLGRMFIPLFLWQRGLLSRPAFYVSAVFEKDRETYYEKLRSVSRKNAWEDWIIYGFKVIPLTRRTPQARSVDYLGIAADLKKALAFYGESGGRGDPAKTQEQAVNIMQEKLDVVAAMLHGFVYADWFTADTSRKL